MAAVLPSEFDELFVLPRDAGPSEERRLSDMSGAQVSAAMEWQQAYLARLVAEGRRAPGEAGEDASLSQRIEQERRRLHRLLTLVTSRTPPHYRDAPLRDSLPQWWPGGR